VAAPLAARRLIDGPRTAAGRGRGRPAQPVVPGAVVVSTAVAPLPQQKQNPGTVGERLKRAKAQAQHRAHKQGRQTPPPSAGAQRSAQTWGLLTTALTVVQAVAEYAGRMSREETSRDWPQYGAVRTAVVALPTEAMVARLRSVVCLAYTVQMPLGQRGSIDPVGHQRRAQWTVTDRVSWCWYGQQLLGDPGDAGSGWLAQPWESLGLSGVVAPTTPTSEPVLAEAA